VSAGERPLVDVRGRFARVVRNGRPIDDAIWLSGRILLSNRRLVLAAAGGKRSLPLANVTEIGGRVDVNQRIAAVSEYVTVRLGDDAFVVAPPEADLDSFRETLYSALLAGETALVRHPAVAGGVVQNTEWERARVKIDAEALLMATRSGSFVKIPLDDVGGVTTSERTIIDEVCSVVEIEHTDEGTSVQTFVAPSPRVASILASVLDENDGDEGIAERLDTTAKQAVMALYSGVSPFDIPEFIGADVDTVEDLFEELIELGVLDEIRVRREVGLSARGRHIATEAIADQ
jgi:helix-turn-helix protein